MKKRLALLLAMVMLTVNFTGCGSGDGASSDATQSGTSASDAGETSGETIKFGIGCPLTGTNAVYGELMKLGAELAAEEINAEGGINGQMVEIVALDDKNDPSEAPLVAQRFCDDEEIYAVISHGGSSVTLAAAPIYEKAGMTNMAPSSSADSITEQGYQYFVRHVIKESRQAPQVMAYLGNNLGCEKVAIIYANNDHGQGNLEVSLEAAEDLGMEVVAQETYIPGTEKDFSALLSKVQAENPDGIALYADYTEGGMILAQAYQIGLTETPWAGQSSLTYAKMVELAGIEACENLGMEVTFNPYSDREVVKNFIEKFEEVRGEDEIPSEPCAFSYDIVKVYAQAIEAGATKDNLALWIKNLVDGQEKFVAHDLLIDDEVEWDENGDVTPRGVSILRVDSNGEFVDSGIHVDISGLEDFEVVD